MHYIHRGVVQLALGEEARGEKESFKFAKETKEWIADIDNIVAHTDGTTADDIDVEFIQDLLLMAIENGAESNPDSDGRGGNGGCGGYGRD